MTNTAPPDLIETMHADVTGSIALLPGHMTRLEYSAHVLAYRWPGRRAAETAIGNTLRSVATPHPAQRVRLLMNASGALHVEAFPLAPLTGTPSIAFASQTLDSCELLLQHKTVHRPWYMPTTTWLTCNPVFFDLIFLNERDEICEGSRSNIYVQKNGVWHTPPLHCGVLGGVMRRKLLDQGDAVESILTRQDLQDPNAAIRLSNGLRGWFDVRVDLPSLLPGHFLP